MKLKQSLSIFGLVAMLGLGVGVGAGLSNEKAQVFEEVSASGTTAHNQDATMIYTEDQRGYSFCTIHIWGLAYATDSASGHTYSSDDFEDYLTFTYGERYTGVWNCQYKEGARWAYKDGNAGDYLIIPSATVGNNPAMTLYLPWWINTGYIQMTNGTDGWLPDGGYGLNGSAGYHGFVKMYYNNQGQMSYVHSENSTKHDFDAYNVTIEKKLANGVSLGNFIEDEAHSSFDYYYPSSNPTHDNYTFEGLYTDAECTETYTAAKPTADLHLYAKFVPAYSVIANNKVRFWVGYDKSNPFCMDDVAVKLWIHDGDNQDYDKYNHVFDNCVKVFNSNDSDRRYDYFDIPTECFEEGYYVTFQRFWNNGANFASYQNVKLASADAGKVYYIWGDWNKGAFSTTIDNNADESLAMAAICSLHTCSNSNINGYGTSFTNFNSTFMGDSDVLDNAYIYDFESKDNSYAHDVDNLVNAKYKYQWLNYKANGGAMPTLVAAGFAGAVENSNLLIVAVIAASAVVLLVIGVYFYFRKRKQD